jgi:hypothetical protein
MFEKVVEIGLLFDFYGKLLSDKQYMVIELYYIHDLSLSEIAEQLNISRQGVYDILKRAEGHLHKYEERLGLVRKFNSNKEKIKEILGYIDLIEREVEDKGLKKIKESTEGIKKIVMDILEVSQEGK